MLLWNWKVLLLHVSWRYLSQRAFPIKRKFRSLHEKCSPSSKIWILDGGSTLLMQFCGPASGSPLKLQRPSLRDLKSTSSASVKASICLWMDEWSDVLTLYANKHFLQKYGLTFWHIRPPSFSLPEKDPFFSLGRSSFAPRSSSPPPWLTSIWAFVVLVVVLTTYWTDANPFASWITLSFSSAV